MIVRLLVSLTAVVALSRISPCAENTVPLRRAHAHNDYEHLRPLLDALDRGFSSVEADVHLVDGKLLVAHDAKDLKPERTLRVLYLEPLKARTEANAGRVHRNGPVFTLLIDMKTDGPSTYEAVERELEAFAALFTTFREGKVETRAIEAIVSGNRPREAMLAKSVRRASYDGRLADIDGDAPLHFLRLVSDRWSDHFLWDGEEEMPVAERAKLAEIVTKAHAKGRRIRFWATPESPTVWKTLFETGVDLLNTDKLGELRQFLLAQNVALAPAAKKGALSVEEALWQRRSTRQFSGEALSPEQLGQVLFAARGLNRPESGKLTTPSAFDAYSVTVFVVTERGVSRYVPQLHALEPVGPRGVDLRAALVTQPELATAPVLLFLVADLAAYPDRVKPERRAPWANGECGAIAGNVHLACESLGLGTVFAAATKWNESKQALGLSEEEMPYYVMPIGKPAAPTNTATNTSTNWPDYRGPTQDGQFVGTALPVRWSEKENVKWKTAIHGRAWSSPVVWGNQVWMGTASPDGKELSSVCVDRDTGRILFDRKLFDIAMPATLFNTVNTYASPSPTIEDGRVVLHFGSPGTACIDSKSFELVWERRDLPCNHFRGPASSPVLFGETVILTFDGSDHDYLVALDKKTGGTVWKTDRSTNYGDIDPATGKAKADGDFRKAYNTPLLVNAAGKLQLVSPGAKAVISYDPATGGEFWKVHYENHSTASRTVFGEGLFFVNTGYSVAELWAIRAGGTGDISATHVAWKRKKAVPNRSSPVLAGGCLYMVSDIGVASCVDAKTGADIWQERIGNQFSSAVLSSAGHVYFFDEEGVATVIRAGPKFDLVAKNRLDDGCLASPAAAGKALFVRTKTHLYRIEE